MRTGVAEMGTPPPLSWLYCDVHCLENYICNINSKAFEMRGVNNQAFIRPTDDDDFLTFVRNVYVVPSNKISEIEPNYLRKMSTETVVQLAINLQAEKCGRNQWKNVLISTPNRPLELKSEPIRILNSSSWEMIHTRIGDDIFLHLLTDTAIFQAVSGSNYVQLTGYPAPKSALRELQKKRLKNLKKTTDRTNMNIYRSPAFRSQPIEGNEAGESLPAGNQHSNLSPITQPNSPQSSLRLPSSLDHSSLVLSALEEAEMECQFENMTEDAIGQSREREHEGSGKRGKSRKNRKEGMRRSGGKQVRERVLGISRLKEIAKKKGKRKFSIGTGGERSETDEIHTQSENHGYRKERRKTSGKWKQGPRKGNAEKSGKPKRLPFHEAISRWPMLYNAWFRSSPGLSKSHILWKTPESDAGALHLFTEVFGTLASHDHQLYQRVMADTLPELRKLLGSFRRVRFGALLEEHCPLPCWFRGRNRTNEGPPGGLHEEHDSSLATQELLDSPDGCEDGLLEAALAEVERAELAEAELAGILEETKTRASKRPKIEKFPGSSCPERNNGNFFRPGLPVEVAMTAGRGPGEDDLPNRGVTAGGSGREVQARRKKKRKTLDGLGSNPEGGAEPETAGTGSAELAPEEELKRLLASSFFSSKASGFVSAVLIRVLPLSLTGTAKRDLRNLRALIARFVRVAKGEEEASLQVASRGLKGLRQRSSPPSRKLPGMFLDAWLFWVLKELVVPIVRGHFFVTSSQHGRKEMLFFRKPVWARVRSLYIHAVAPGTFQELSLEEAYAVLGAETRSLGFANLRLVPKRDGLRPIANLGTASSLEPPRRVKQGQARSSAATAAGQEGQNGQAESRTGQVESRGGQESESGGQDAERFGQARSRMRSEARLRQRRAQSQRRERQMLRWRLLIGRPTGLKFEALNSSLGDLHACVKFLSRYPGTEFLGTSVFGYDDVYRRLRGFVTGWKSRPLGSCQLYFAVCDVAKAFDSVDQKTLLDILEAMFTSWEANAGARLYLRHISTTKPIGGRFHISKDRLAESAQEISTDIVQRSGLTKRHSIIVDQGASGPVNLAGMRQLLQEHVRGHIVRIGGTFFRQTVGIPQGSLMSSLMCSLFYADMERTHLLPRLAASRKLPAGESLLLRLIDDSLFVSSSRAEASRFVELLHQGFPRYGCRANQSKTRVSFPLEGVCQLAGDSGAYRDPDGTEFVKWAGLLISVRSLDIRADYTRYWEADLATAVGVPRGPRACRGPSLVVRMFAFLRPKCHPLLFDAALNSPFTVFVNCHQCFLMCAMKAHVYIRSGMAMGPQTNPGFFFRAILKALWYMHQMVENRMSSAREDFGPGCVNVLDLKSVHWLGLVAFRNVLRRKGAVYGKLLAIIEGRLRSREYEEVGRSEALQMASSGAYNSIFDKIRF